MTIILISKTIMFVPLHSPEVSLDYDDGIDDDDDGDHHGQVCPFEQCGGETNDYDDDLDYYDDNDDKSDYDDHSDDH